MNTVSVGIVGAIFGATLLVIMLRTKGLPEAVAPCDVLLLRS